MQECVFSKKKEDMLLDAMKEIEYYNCSIDDENAKPISF